MPRWWKSRRSKASKKMHTSASARSTNPRTLPLSDESSSLSQNEPAQKERKKTRSLVSFFLPKKRLSQQGSATTLNDLPQIPSQPTTESDRIFPNRYSRQASVMAAPPAYPAGSNNDVKPLTQSNGFPLRTLHDLIIENDSCFGFSPSSLTVMRCSCAIVIVLISTCLMISLVAVFQQ